MALSNLAQAVSACLPLMQNSICHVHIPIGRSMLICLCSQVTCVSLPLQDGREEDRRWMTRLGRVLFVVERTRRTRPADVAALVIATSEQVDSP